MAETMSGLFGPSPYEVEQQRRTQMGTDATNFANMNATQRGVMGMYKGAGMLAGAGAEAMGMVDPAVANAQAMRQAAQGVDTGTPEGLMEFAQKIQTFAPEKAAQAVAMARKMKADAAAAALAQNKDDRAQQKLEEVDKQRMENDYNIKLATLEATKQRDREMAESRAATTEQREAASKRADATDRYIAGLTAEMRRLGLEAKTSAAAAKSATGEKPLTADQRMKWERKKGEDIGTLQAVETELDNMVTQATALKKHPGLPGATGMSGYLYSKPGGDSATAEALLDEFKASTSAAGLEKVRMGGGIGAMTVQEWPLVERMIANIDPKKLGLKGTQDAIDKVINKMKAMSSVAKKRYQAIHGESAPGEMDGETPPPPADNAKPPAKPRIKFDANGNIIK